MKWPWVSRKTYRNSVWLLDWYAEQDRRNSGEIKRLLWEYQLLKDKNIELRYHLSKYEGPKQHYENLVK